MRSNLNVLIIEIPLKPISVNAAFQGKRYKTDECKRFDRDCQLVLMRYRGKIERFERYEVIYNLYLKNAALTDWDNCIKILQDNLVTAGLISDDRKIYRATINKIPDTTDRVHVRIMEWKAF